MDATPSDQKCLLLFRRYCEVQQNIALNMSWAIDAFERADEKWCLIHLFDWCIVREQRSKIWQELNPVYSRALRLCEASNEYL